MIKINLPEIRKFESKPSYCLTVFQDKLVLARVVLNAGIDQDDLSIFCFFPKLRTWQCIYNTPLFQANQTSSSHQREMPTERRLSSSELDSWTKDHARAHIQAAILPGPSETSEYLYICACTSNTQQVIHTENGELFEIVETISDDLAEILLSKEFLTSQNVFYTLPSRSINQDVRGGTQSSIQTYVLRELAQGEQISFPSFQGIDNQEVSGFSLFDNALHISTVNVHTGFQLWKAEAADIASGITLPEAQPILSEGAYRYVLNQQISGMISFRGNLYLASGLKMERRKEQENEFYPVGFEIIRIYPDNDWDVIVGTPRFTKDGLKVPLSTKGPGFDDPYLAQVECFTIHNDCLYLATQNLDTLQIWHSEDGEEWKVLPLSTDLGRYRDLESCKILSTPWGLVLAIHSYNVDGIKQLEIWLNE